MNRFFVGSTESRPTGWNHRGALALARNRVALHWSPVKLSQKVAKLGQKQSYTRLARRLRRRLHPIPLEPLLARLDQNRMREIEERYRNSDVGIAKYARVPEFMKMNAERVQDLDLHRLPPLDILDLGCGGGFFLYIAPQ